VKLTRPRPARRTTAAAGLVLVGLLLTGCGSSLGIHPGSAIVVGDHTLSMKSVDSTSSSYCQAYIPTIQSQGGGKIPMRYLRQFVAGSLAERLIGQGLAAAYNVSPASGYRQSQAQVLQQFSQAPADQLKAVLDVEGGDPYLQNVQVAVGQQLTGNFGQATSDLKAAQQRGAVATQAWLRGQTFAVDPSLGVTLENGQVTLARGETSYPVSALAVSGAKQSGTPDASYTAALSPSQLCG
jgi:hypothetical protein